LSAPLGNAAMRPKENRREVENGLGRKKDAKLCPR